MQFFRNGDVVIHFQIIGEGSGKPVLVFANSLGTDFRIWRDVVVALAGDFTIVTYDKRGHGLSDATPAPYSISTHVDDAARLLDYMGLKQVIFCGLSVGGLIGQGLYQARPELIRALILCDTGHKIGSEESWQTRIDHVSDGGLEPLADDIMKLWFTSTMLAADQDAVRLYRNMLVRQDVEGYNGTCAVLRDVDFTEACGSIEVPTLCVVGDQDVPTPPQLVQEMAELIPGARFEIIDGAAHLPCVEQPEMLVELIRGFVAGLEGSGEGRT